MLKIGIDIGGTTIKVGLVDGNGKILMKNRVPTEKNAQKAVDNMAKQINEILESMNLNIDDINGIGIGCPGLISSETGVVDCANNLQWFNEPICDMLKQYFNVEIRISNDANVAALGESKFGCASKFKNSVMLTLGTGVGGGIVCDNKIFEGGHSKGAELGHVTLIYNGELCTCGRKGCIESYASATALIRDTKRQMLVDKNSKMWEFVDGNIDNVDGRTAFECAKLGDKSAKIVRDNYIAYLSESIMSLNNIFRADAFILGGGVSAQKSYLTDRIKKYCEKLSYGFKNATPPVILTATLGNDAGIIGASALID